MRNLEVIGEAVSNLSDEFKNQHPDISWKDAKRMRNFLIHVYFSIDYRIVWSTVKNDLPDFKTKLTAIL